MALSPTPRFVERTTTFSSTHVANNTSDSIHQEAQSRDDIQNRPKRVLNIIIENIRILVRSESAPATLPRDLRLAIIDYIRSMEEGQRVGISSKKFADAVFDLWIELSIKFGDDPEWQPLLSTLKDVDSPKLAQDCIATFNNHHKSQLVHFVSDQDEPEPLLDDVLVVDNSEALVEQPPHNHLLTLIPQQNSSTPAATTVTTTTTTTDRALNQQPVRNVQDNVQSAMRHDGLRLLSSDLYPSFTEILDWKTRAFLGATCQEFYKAYSVLFAPEKASTVFSVLRNGTGLTYEWDPLSAHLASSVLNIHSGYRSLEMHSKNGVSPIMLTNIAKGNLSSQDTQKLRAMLDHYKSLDTEEAIQEWLNNEANNDPVFQRHFATSVQYWPSFIKTYGKVQLDLESALLLGSAGLQKYTGREPDLHQLIFSFTFDVTDFKYLLYYFNDVHFQAFVEAQKEDETPVADLFNLYQHENRRLIHLLTDPDIVNCLIQGNYRVFIGEPYRECRQPGSDGRKYVNLDTLQNFRGRYAIREQLEEQTCSLQDLVTISVNPGNPWGYRWSSEAGFHVLHSLVIHGELKVSEFKNANALQISYLAWKLREEGMIPR